MIIVIAIYIGITLLYKTYQKNKVHLYYEEQQKIAARASKVNQAFLPPKDIPESQPVRILVLGGGGINGIISVKILDFLEKESNSRISDLFDAIYGTSIGGLEATFLTLPDSNGKSRYRAADLLNFMKKDATAVLKINGFHAFLSGLGLVSPIVDSQNYITLLRSIIGDTQLSQLTATVVLPGYELEKNEIQFFSSRKDILNQPNFLLYQLLSGTTAVVGAFPPQRVYSISNNDNYLLADPNLIINNPIIAALIHANIMYPKNPKIIVFIGLGLYKQKKETDFYNGLIGGAGQYMTMIRSGSPDKLFNLYVDILEDNHRLGLRTGSAYYINVPVNFSIGNSLDTSPEHILHIESIADSIIASQKYELLEIVKRLTTN
jgi:patatin-like phospholipase/acyl hydrolase